MARITSLLFIVPVNDLERAVEFYQKAFELEVVYEGERIVFAGLPGTDIALGILHDPERAGSGPQHVGLHIDHAITLDDAIRDVEAAGGTVIERGERPSGIPFARVADVDGNLLEL